MPGIISSRKNHNGRNYAPKGIYQNMNQNSKTDISFFPDKIDQWIRCCNSDQVFPRGKKVVDGEQDRVQERRPLSGISFHSWKKIAAEIQFLHERSGYTAKHDISEDKDVYSLKVG